jgi:acetamidase/formamidase
LEHKVRPTNYTLLHGPAEPLLKIRPGDTISANCIDARGYDETGTKIQEKIVQSRDGTSFRWGNPLVGPFYVEGAEITDTLTVNIEKVEPNRDFAWSLIGPNYGCFTGEVWGRRLLMNEPLELRRYEWILDRENRTATLQLKDSILKTIEIPLHPFIGTIGVAPRFGRQEMVITPGEYGGNMDCIETKEDTTVYLPIFVRGAYLAFGDVHAAQGDGEVSGSALEVSADVKLKIDVLKNRTIEWPRFQDDEYIMTVGSTRPLMDALKIAYIEMVNWLENDYGFEKFEALHVISQVGLCRVGNVGNPNYTVVAKFPKKYLPKLEESTLQPMNP